jgi:hypothetical protein
MLARQTLLPLELFQGHPHPLLKKAFILSFLHVFTYVYIIWASFKVLDLILRSLIHFGTILVKGERHGSISVFCRQITTFPSNIC